jgi:hypothetical protein
MLANLSTLTDAQAELAAEIADGHPCPECGRPDDWLAEGHDGTWVYLHCDDCCRASVRFTLTRLTTRQERG